MSFFSTQEMACISYNRLKLEAASKRGNKNALKIKHMIDNPLLLFGTTLFGVNICLVVSSESARQAFQCLEISPNYSIFFHIPYVLVFGELVPMFAARLFPEHMAKLGIPVLWATSTILHPFIATINRLFSSLTATFKRKAVTSTHSAVIQLDELQELLHETIEDSGRIKISKSKKKKKVVESRMNREELSSYEGYIMDSAAGRILSLRDKLVGHYMTAVQDSLFVHPLQKIEHACKTVHQASQTRKKKADHSSAVIEDTKLAPYLLLKEKQNKIIGIIAAQDLFSCHFTKSKKEMQLSHRTATAFDLALAVCYIAEKSTLSETLLRMKRENVEVALIIGTDGDISGYISIEDILEELHPHVGNTAEVKTCHLEKTVQGDEEIIIFTSQFGISPIVFGYEHIKAISQGVTFSEYVEKRLGRKPHVGDAIEVGYLQLTVVETTLLGAKSIFVQTKEV